MYSKQCSSRVASLVTSNAYISLQALPVTNRSEMTTGGSTTPKDVASCSYTDSGRWKQAAISLTVINFLPGPCTPVLYHDLPPALSFHFKMWMITS